MTSPDDYPQLDASTIHAPGPWDFLLALLDCLGVDRRDALSADIHIEAEATEGKVTVTQVARDESGLLYPPNKESGIVTLTSVHYFERPAAGR